VLSGDSAGAHLVLAVLCYIHGNNTLLQAPCGALLWSPWVNMQLESLKQHPNSTPDLLPVSLLAWGIRTFTPPLNGYGTPAANPFLSRTPIFVQMGQAEVLYDTIMRFVDNMRGVVGNKVDVLETRNAPHDILLVDHSPGFGKEAPDAVDAAGVFLRDLNV
jgi:acetyl esterase/lipase